MLKWLWGSSIVSLLIALASDQVLKAVHSHTEAAALGHNARGGIFGAVAGITLATIGTPKAKKSVSGWRDKVVSAVKNK